MSDAQKQRIQDLQRSLRLAKSALERIKDGHEKPGSLADEALDQIWPLETKRQLQGLVGHEQRRRPA